jgi:hypothetical protein
LHLIPIGSSLNPAWILSCWTSCIVWLCLRPVLVSLSWFDYVSFVLPRRHHQFLAHYATFRKVSLPDVRVLVQGVEPYFRAPHFLVVPSFCDPFRTRICLTMRRRLFRCARFCRQLGHLLALAPALPKLFLTDYISDFMRRHLRRPSQQTVISLKYDLCRFYLICMMTVSLFLGGIC